MAFTNHGHHVPGTTFNISDRPDSVARCGGPGICKECSLEVTKLLIDNPFNMLSEEKPNMDDFQLKAMILVANYFNERAEKTDKVILSVDNVYVVWFSKTLQNWKALVSTTVPDGMYYEVTYNGDKQETYIDAYKKFDNVTIPD